MDTIELWRYPRFFTENMKLSDSDLRHAKQVLRMKSGDKAILSEDCVDYLCEYSDGEFTVLDSTPNQAEPTVKVKLFQCLPKSDKMDFIVQKAVELGVSEIVPVISTRCISRPKDTVNKITRWNKIAYEAAKQCGRGKVPVVCDLIDFKNVKADGSGIIFYECGGKPISETLTSCGSVSVLIGSEGGFEKSEVETAQLNGFTPATLGKRILRVDTASVAALSIIMNITGNI